MKRHTKFAIPTVLAVALFGCGGGGSGGNSPSYGVTPVQQITIKDPVLQTALQVLGVPVNDGKVNQSDALKVTYIEIISSKRTNATCGDVCYDTGFAAISDMSGIEGFTNLSSLYINGQTFTTINVSSLTNLTGLAVEATPITTINVSNNTALTFLNLNDDMLTTLDVSHNQNLQTLSVEGEGLYNTGCNGTVLTYLNLGSDKIPNLETNCNLNLQISN